MYCQLGNIVFNGLKSFISFGDEKEVTIAEHALINRKPKLQGSAVGLKKINISLYLHQEFCVVKNEVAALVTAMETFEIMPLLWGNGELEGNFSINKIGRTVNDQDGLGNIYACTISVELTEVADEGDRLEVQQQQARKDAFATGDKKPAVKSNRVNSVSCNKKIAKHVAAIESYAKKIDDNCRSYRAGSTANQYMLGHLRSLKIEAAALVTMTNTSDSCVYNDTSLRTYSNNVANQADTLYAVASNNELTPFLADSARIATENTALQAKVRALKLQAGKNINNSVVRKG